MSKNQLPLERFLELEATQPNKVYLRQPYNGKWITYTWREVGQEARKLAHAIKAMDLPEKSNIALMSKKLCSLDHYRLGPFGWRDMFRFLSTQH